MPFTYHFTSVYLEVTIQCTIRLVFEASAKPMHAYLFSLPLPHSFFVRNGFVQWFLAVNSVINFTFLVDTLISFFRAFRDKNGRLVYSLRSIRRQYIRSGYVLFCFHTFALTTSTLTTELCTLHHSDGSSSTFWLPCLGR